MKVEICWAYTMVLGFSGTKGFFMDVSEDVGDELRCVLVNVDVNPHAVLVAVLLGEGGIEGTGNLAEAFSHATAV